MNFLEMPEGKTRKTFWKFGLSISIAACAISYLISTYYPSIVLNSFFFDLIKTPFLFDAFESRFRYGDYYGVMYICTIIISTIFFLISTILHFNFLESVDDYLIKINYTLKELIFFSSCTFIVNVVFIMSTPDGLHGPGIYNSFIVFGASFFLVCVILSILSGSFVGFLIQIIRKGG
jgi:hypothetical protein